MNRTKRPDRRHLLDTARHPRRRDGAIAVVLLLLPWVVALFLGPRLRHLDVGTAIALFFGLFAVSLGLPTLWLMWTTYRGPKRGDISVGEPSLGQVADQLAVAVGTQWEAEAAIRRLNDPYPLPVSWGVADSFLTDSWESLARLATSGAGWPALPPPGTWAAGPDDLGGEGSQLADVLVRVPTGRLVVLGEPGAGKTMLMVRLALDLLARRTSGEAVPMLASVASWNPAIQDLREWLSAQLLTDYPWLDSPPPGSMSESNQAEALLASGLILPILDGLDEIPDVIRGSAIARINDAVRPGEQLVVTCRSQQYWDAARPTDGAEVSLRGAAAVQLHPLDADVVGRYLCDDAAGPVAKARWEPVLGVLGTNAPAGQALRTPLMVGLARAIYNPRPGELARELRKPEELCAPDLADQNAVESLLFDAFIPAAYRLAPRSNDHRQWSAQKAEPWLIFLARRLEEKIDFPDLAWWRFQRTVPLAVFGFVATLPVWLVVAFPYLTAHWLENAIMDGVAIGLVFGLTAILTTALRRLPGPSGSALRRLGINGLVAGLLLGLAGAIAAGLSAANTLNAQDFGWGLLFGLAGLLATGFAVALRKPPGCPDRTRRQFIGSAFIVGLVLGLAGGLGFGVGGGLTSILGIGFNGMPAVSERLPEGLSAGIDVAFQFTGGFTGIVIAGATFALGRWSMLSLRRLGSDLR